MSPKTTSQREQEERVRVGATLRTIRTTRGWNLGDLATHVDVSYSYLSNIEAGRKPLTDILLARIATALGVEQIAIKVPTGKTSKAEAEAVA